MTHITRNLNIGTSLCVVITISAAWLIISAGCGNGPAVSRPNKPLPPTEEVHSAPETILK